MAGIWEIVKLLTPLFGELLKGIEAARRERRYSMVLGGDITWVKDELWKGL